MFTPGGNKAMEQSKNHTHNQTPANGQTTALTVAKGKIPVVSKTQAATNNWHVRLLVFSRNV